MVEAQRYWQSADEDAAMQEKHEFIWRAMLDTIDLELLGRRVLDAGTRPPGFLRLLASEAGIAALARSPPPASARRRRV